MLNATRLAPLTSAMAPTIDAFAADPEILGLLLLPRPSPPDPGRNWIRRLREREALNVEHAFAIEADGAACVGVVTITGVQPRRHRGQLAYWIHRDHRRRGYATDASRQALAYAHVILKLSVIYTAVSASNRASLRVVEKLGFRRLDTPPFAWLPSDSRHCYAWSARPPREEP
jgi:RimJ/RimL family protein N-acetyltransferase